MQEFFENRLFKKWWRPTVKTAYFQARPNEIITEAACNVRDIALRVYDVRSNRKKPSKGVVIFIDKPSPHSQSALYEMGFASRMLIGMRYENDRFTVAHQVGDDPRGFHGRPLFMDKHAMPDEPFSPEKYCFCAEEAWAASNENFQGLLLKATAVHYGMEYRPIGTDPKEQVSHLWELLSEKPSSGEAPVVLCCNDASHPVPVCDQEVVSLLLEANIDIVTVRLHDKKEHYAAFKKEWRAMEKILTHDQRDHYKMHVDVLFEDKGFLRPRGYPSADCRYRHYMYLAKRQWVPVPDKHYRRTE